MQMPISFRLKQESKDILLNSRELRFFEFRRYTKFRSRSIQVILDGMV